MSSRKRNRAGLTFSLKLSFLYALFFVISSVGLFVVAYCVISNLVEQREREIIRGRIDEYAAWYAEGGLRALKTRFDKQSDFIRDVLFVRVIGPRNNVLFVSVPKGVDHIHLKGLRSAPPPRLGEWNSVPGRDRHNHWTVATARLKGGLLLQVGKSSTEARRLLEYFRSAFWWFVIPVLLLGIAGGGLLTYRAIRPIRSLIQTVKGILQTGEMSMRVPTSNEKGELNELVGLFNRMLDKNDRLIQGMHHALDSVAHDLRTPMTRLRGTAEFALQDSENEPACREALADCMEESERVLTMLNILMDVAEAETGAMNLEPSPVSVAELVSRVVELYELVAEEAGMRVQTDIPGDLIMMADPMRLQQVLANLLDNALKYGREGQTVRISARRREHETVISVTDQGIGIPAEELNRIWDRLYRGDQSRSRRGLGLGLSFVQAIVQAHGGMVSVESRVNEGATFTIRIPSGMPAEGPVRRKKKRSG